MSIEIEILFELQEDSADVSKKLRGFSEIGTKHTLDEYFYDTLRENLKIKEGRLRECFRIRQKGDACYMTYKKDHFDGDVWSHSDEMEVVVSDLEKTREVIHALGLQPLVTIASEKKIYKNDHYEVVIESVEGLGSFLEVECIRHSSEPDVMKEKEKIRELVRELGIKVGKELNSGKPELMLHKQAAA